MFSQNQNRPFLKIIILAKRVQSFGIVILLATIAGGLAGCENKISDVETSSEISGWDTTLTYHGFNALNAEAMTRAIVSSGHEERFSAFLKKCRVGGDIRIGFVGGSVTAGAVSTRLTKRYSTLLCAFLGKYFPRAHFIEINAGIGGTDSRFGVSRLNEDILDSKPDLVLIEYAVNDDPADSTLYPLTLEGMVRQCLVNKDVAVMLYFTTNSVGSTASENAKIPIGFHYGLPMVSLLRAVWPYETQGNIPIDSIIAEVVHPTDMGHFISAYCLFSFIREVSQKQVEIASEKISAPMYGTIYDTAGIFHSGDQNLKIVHQGNWMLKEKEFGRFGMTNQDPGDSLLFQYYGKELTIGYHVTKFGTSKLEVVLNEKPIDTLSDFFERDWGGGYMKLKRVWINEVPQSVSVKLKLLKGKDFVVDYILYAGQKI